MKTLTHLICITFLSVLLAACGGDRSETDTVAKGMHGVEADPEPEKGPHRGRLLKDGDFLLELSIFETGVPPEFRVWVTERGQPVKPDDIDLAIKLTRLGDRTDNIGFKTQGDFLRGDTVIYEPHSFVVSIEAIHKGKTHRWQYDNFEGRTKISPEMAEAFELETLVAGPAVLHETVTVYGRIMTNTERVREVSARFDGVIQSVYPSLGDTILEGQPLAKVESNESLKSYTIKAPIGGVITQRDANPGEQTGGRLLFTITDTSSVWVDLSVFPADRERVRAGAPVTISAATGGQPVEGIISRVNILAEANQAVTARTELDNTDGLLLPGTYVTAEVTVGTHPVPLAVKRTGLQAFRDFTVVYAQIGDEYEVRMLELGRQDREWIEVLGGLDPGTRYVSENSYLVKADIEKSGASHDH
jgi:cobalt-zinc-cadmium efflux system membrane fusion protein